MAEARVGRHAIIRRMRGTGLQKGWRGQRAGVGAVRGGGEEACRASGSRVLLGEQVGRQLFAGLYGKRLGKEEDRWGDAAEEC